MKRFLQIWAPLVLAAATVSGTAHADDAAIQEDLKDVASKGDMITYFAKAIASRESANIEQLQKWVKFCNEAADKAIADGASPGAPILVGELKTTLGAFKADVCAKSAAVADAWMDEVMGPYKKVLKNDKYDLLFEQYPDGFYLPRGGGESTKDPQELAKANVWFEILEGDAECARGKIYTYIRYQFDKNQKVAKRSTHDYCGDPGVKVLK
jgi:hypothetical protein